MRSYLGLGSNLGNRAANLAEAVRRLGELGTVLEQSNTVETEPWGVADQPRFLNMVVALETEIPPHDLLAAVKDIEDAVGRVPTYRWGPRVIDIDILTYGDLCICTPTLTVPHPRIAEREFVLAPLRQIAPDVAARFAGEEASHADVSL